MFLQIHVIKLLTLTNLKTILSKVMPNLYSLTENKESLSKKKKKMLGKKNYTQEIDPRLVVLEHTCNPST
jgi:hypothetical protein